MVVLHRILGRLPVLRQIVILVRLVDDFGYQERQRGVVQGGIRNPDGIQSAIFNEEAKKIPRPVQEDQNHGCNKEDKYECPPARGSYDHGDMHEGAFMQGDGSPATYNLQTATNSGEEQEILITTN